MPMLPATAMALCSLCAVTVLASRSGERRTYAGDAWLDEQWRPRHGDFGYEGDKRIRHHEEFGYEGDNGPDKWPSLFPDCGGQLQSPLDVSLSATQRIRFLTPLVVPDFEWAPSQVKIINNGHTVMLVPMDRASVEHRLLSGGPLKGSYRLEQLHFHWGQTDAKGSEHAINGDYHAMEMHMVFAKTTSRLRQKSSRARDDIAVIGVFLKVTSRDSRALGPIVSHLPLVQRVGAEVVMHDKVNTAGLLPCLCCGLVVYNGSLTTPPCSETVTWLVFLRPIIVSAKQVAEFRKVSSPTGQLTWNRRPVQPLNSRTVYRAGSTTTPRASCVLLFAWALWLLLV